MMTGTAKFSECGFYRYELTRSWNDWLPGVLFIGLNPSTADAVVTDQTIRVRMGYARRWEYGSLMVANLFAYRSTR